MPFPLIPLKVIIPIGLVIIILVIVLGVLTSKNNKLYACLLSEKKKFSTYKKAVKTLKNSTQEPQKDLSNLSKYVKGFFSEYLSLSSGLTYLELEKHFKMQNKNEYARFCKLISDAGYSGEEITKQQITQLVNIFSKLIYEFQPEKSPDNSISANQKLSNNENN